MKTPDIFGMVAIPLANVDRRWTAVRNLTLADWPAPYLNQIAAAPTMIGKAHMADGWVNSNVLYQADALDAWAPPSATLAARSGDCEDFALLKRALLIHGGVAADRLYLLLVWDKISRRDHALLAVDTEDNRNLPPQFVVMDSFNSLTLPAAEASADYMPLMAFCEGSAWAYGKRVAGPVLKV